MQYFDLNIPFLEDPSSGKTTPLERAARKKTRLKLVVKAVELGYSGVAYSRSINGVMSESDRCSASLFPLSNLLELSPSMSSSTSFHRRLLSGPHTAHSPFRQFTCITVSVDNPSQSSSLNSGNPILKTYDLVAVRPMNQVAFDQACKNSEVDLIAIDLCYKMPFRLKLPMVKAAIARGVYFEITYSSLIVDIQVRRQVISNAKVLVDWTRGKNLIVSSAAPSALEFRGPNDVANLLSLLGLVAEHAKAAISKNCRDLIAKALRKKQFNEAVKVNAMPSTTKPDPNKPWIIDSMEWDPISSGDGDLLLEDLAKSLSEASKESETLKPNGFTSSVNKVVPQGLKATNLGAETETIRTCSQRKPLSLFSIPFPEPEIVLNNSVNSMVSLVKGYEVLDVGLMQDDEKSIYTQTLEILNTESILKKCNNLEDVSAQFNDAICHRNQFIVSSETTQQMAIDDINADPGFQNVTETSSLSQMDKKDQSDPSLIPPDCLIPEVTELRDYEEINKEVSLPADKMMDVDSSGHDVKDGEILLCADPAVKGVLPVDLNSGDEAKDTSSIRLDRDPSAKKILEGLELCTQKIDNHLSTSTSYVDPSERISRSNDLLIHDSDMILEEQAHADIQTNSVKRMTRQRRYIRFPFKHLLQVPFKRKAGVYKHKIRKR